MRASVGWAKAPDTERPLSEALRAFAHHGAPPVGNGARGRPHRRDGVSRRCPTYSGAVLPSLRAPTSEPARQDLPQHASLDGLVGRGRVMPPEAIAPHGLGRCYESLHDRGEIRIRVVEAEDQAP